MVLRTAGSLGYERVMLQRPGPVEAASVTAEGYAQQNWEDVRMVSANITGQTGTETVQGQAGVFAESTHQVWIRRDPAMVIEPTWRLRGTGYYLNIQSVVDPDGKRRWWRLSCKIAYDDGGRA